MELEDGGGKVINVSSTASETWDTALWASLGLQSQTTESLEVIDNSVCLDSVHLCDYLVFFPYMPTTSWFHDSCLWTRYFNFFDKKEEEMTSSSYTNYLVSVYLIGQNDVTWSTLAPWEAEKINTP
jgi:hypothetical protein